MTSPTTRRGYRYFDLVMAVFVAVLLISNVASSKILDLGPFTFDGGTILFPISYIFGDVLTEVYGYARSRRVIWIGFGCALLMSVTFAIVGALPSNAEWGNQAAYEVILGQTPRIVIASLIAYFAGEFSNSFTLAKMKVWTGGRWLWTRTIGSTLVGEGVDTLLFVIIAFAGLYSTEVLVAIIISNYVFKCSFEALATPATYWIVNHLKRAEREDYYDYHTDFNPFRVVE
ncbi:MAG: queuosine precursor transporter [Chloroflexi bacterium]|nr:queuosine precursor transporter [Chloroflexota bacterium]MBU1750529.1 queuosine precursor transporter [Chloroflexota bacterium]MBU1877451.1 queuosine precursor transporter [Chloroflexota bacterium]